ncbi:MAG: nucleoid-associated protein, partial [Atopobiaceae bacterium]|nr:nucleoid-associated protein [Atopobiaceae bacterium]
MIRINHAVLHAFDFEVGECDLSERELDLDVRQTKSYVTRMARKTVGNPESKHGEFAEGSNFAGELERYLHGQRDFLDLSADVARFFYEELRKSEDAGQCDLLVTDFVDTGDAKGESARAEAADTAVGDAMAAAIEAADDFEGGERRMFAVLLLPRRQAFVHDVRSEGGLAYNDIVRHDSTLPNPSQKVPTFAVVDTTDFSIDFQDVERTIAGQKALLIPKAFLQCSTEASSREVIATVTKIVEDVAEEYGIEPAV